MTDSHETNHAAGARSCHAEGVRAVCISLIWVGGALVLANQFMREQRRYRAFTYSSNGNFSSYEDMEDYVDNVEKTLLPKSFFGRVTRWLHWGKLFGRFYPVSVNCFGYICNQIEQFIFALQLVATKLFYKMCNVAFPRKFFRNHQKSSPSSGCCEQKMDDGGRHGNVPPGSCAAGFPENANAGAEKPLRPEDFHLLKSVTYPKLFEELLRKFVHAE